MSRHSPVFFQTDCRGKSYGVPKGKISRTALCMGTGPANSFKILDLWFGSDELYHKYEYTATIMDNLVIRKVIYCEGQDGKPTDSVLFVNGSRYELDEGGIYVAE